MQRTKQLDVYKSGVCSKHIAKDFYQSHFVILLQEFEEVFGQTDRPMDGGRTDIGGSRNSYIHFHNLLTVNKLGRSVFIEASQRYIAK